MIRSCQDGRQRLKGQYREQDEMQDIEHQDQDQDQEMEQDERTTVAVAVATHHTNVRFNMILSNNISHLHQLMNNSNTMSEECEEQLQQSA